MKYYASALLAVPIGLPFSSALVVTGSILATAAPTAGDRGSTAGAALALFAAMLWSGAALRRRRRQQP